MAEKMMSAIRGKRVVITGAPHQAAELEGLLQAKGAIPLLYPCIKIAAPQNTATLDQALYNWRDNAFDWVIFTSANAVRVVAQRLHALNLMNIPTQAHQRHAKLVSVDMETAQAVEKYFGLMVDFIPAVFSADSLYAMLNSGLMVGARVLLTQSQTADNGLQDTLTAAGANVTAVETYRTLIGTGGVDLAAMLAAYEVNAITYTSPTTIKNLFVRLQAEHGDPYHLAGVVHVCTDLKTAREARRYGLTNDAHPKHTLNGLVNALEQSFR